MIGAALTCDHPGCGKVCFIDLTDDFDCSAMIDTKVTGTPIFTMDVGWINCPETWGMTADGKTYCPMHTAVEV